MTRVAVMFLAAVAMSVASGAARAQELPEMALAKDLLLPCQDADNDARDGYISHLECVGYIRGFVAALEVTSGAEKLCFPEANRDDQLRRAFVRWVHGAFRDRSKMPVGEALLEALDDSFGCS
ncbi:MAG TPA: hypothetical protein DIU07_04940 [Rhodobacteraceae bacterium]|nr:hypothetical protein [Paracoccaceae bacterium]